MITDKNKAIEEISKANVNFDLFDKKLFEDKDVVRAYMQRHSSNTILVSKVPIDINYSGMIDNESFIIDVIKNLDVGYDKNSLEALLRFSTSSIIRKRLDNKGVVADEERLKMVAKRILMRFNSQLKRREAELSSKRSLLNAIDTEIFNASLSAFSDDTPNHKKQGGRYKRNDIGFTAKF